MGKPSETTFGRIIEGKGSVTVQTATLAAILMGGWQAGGYAERAETKLVNIETAIAKLEQTTGDNSAQVAGVLATIASMDAKGTAALALFKAETEAKISRIQTCLAKGSRKCPM